MSFEESLVMVSPFPVIQQQEEDDGFNKIRNSLSRLSICTTSVYDEEEDKEPIKNERDEFGVSMSECFDGAEADGEVSDDDDGGGRRGKENIHVHVSDSDQEIYSLPVTPSRRRSNKLQDSGEFDDGKKCNLRKQRRVNKEKKKQKKKRNGFNGGDGESDGVGLTMLTRAKGGEKSLRMGLEEVKACRDLGFELEPGRISVSTGSNFDTPTQTSSGSNSPIATWRISSPGDDPKEVKARLKVWAQAVALASSPLASASRQSSMF